MRGAGGGGADAAGVGALTPSMKVYVAPFIQLLQYHYLLYTVLYLYSIYSTVNGATVQYSTSTVLLYCTVLYKQTNKQTKTQKNSTEYCTVQYSTVYTVLYI